MPRHGRNDPRVQDVTRALARLVLRFGSVNAVAEGLTEALSDGEARIYPNRIHGLLIDDVSRGVNSSTLAALESACASIQEPDTWAIEPAEVSGALAAASGHERRYAQQLVADKFGVPIGVIQAVATPMPPPQREVASMTRIDEPDWSWQDLAVKQSLVALKAGAGLKVGLVLPTGAGKTRVALRIALQWLDHSDGRVLWVTHRHHLRSQARRTLQALIREKGLSTEQATETFARIEFSMTHGLAAKLDSLGSTLSMVIVDEAHHAAAASYQPILAEESLPGLFLTATPNRTDELPIGIDKIAFTTTYRELFERGCVIEPTFDPPEEMPDLDWSSSAGLRNLADYLLERTETDFSKPLVAVSLQARAELLHEAILEQLDTRSTHPLAADDVGYVHSGSNSRGLSETTDFLDEFSAKPAGILIATSQLVGEGFDDPLIDAAVITYPSTSIGHLMQVAGRALRWSPGKTTAHIVQVRQSPLEYHFDQRWLYQDISDALHPELLDFAYSSSTDLMVRAQSVLEHHRTSEPIQQRILADLAKVESGQKINIMLSGLSYYGPADAFDSDAQWSAILVAPTERERFVRFFNDVSARAEDIKESHAYLSTYLNEELIAGSLWKSYGALLPAMENARREIQGTTYAGRPFQAGRATTWLKYVTFEFSPVVPEVLADMLADAYNRESLLAAYIDEPTRWLMALRLELPVAGSEGYLLDAEQASWFMDQHQKLLPQLAECDRSQALGALRDWRSTLASVPIPVTLVDNYGQFLRPERQDRHVCDLRAVTVDE